LAPSQSKILDVQHALPLFDVPEFTLFPHTIVPFHVYDERYSGVLDDCLTDRRLMVFAGLKPGWQEAGADAPVYEVAGLGRVLSDRRFHDGRYNIFVHCIARVRIRTQRQLQPYRSVDVELIEDRMESRNDLVSAHRRILTLGTNLVMTLGEEGGALSKLLCSTQDPGILSNRLGAMLLDEPECRQSLLEERSATARCHILEEVLIANLMRETGLPETGSLVN
jgi:Lon protease-like protein